MKDTKLLVNRHWTLFSDGRNVEFVLTAGFIFAIQYADIPEIVEALKKHLEEQGSDGTETTEPG